MPERGRDSKVAITTKLTGLFAGFQIRAQWVYGLAIRV